MISYIELSRVISERKDEITNLTQSTRADDTQSHALSMPPRMVEATSTKNLIHQLHDPISTTREKNESVYSPCASLEFFPHPFKHVQAHLRVMLQTSVNNSSEEGECESDQSPAQSVLGRIISVVHDELVDIDAQRCEERKIADYAQSHSSLSVSGEECGIGRHHDRMVRERYGLLSR